MGKYLLAWFAMVLLAIANGALRDGWYGKHMAELRAHQLSTASGIVLFGIYIWLILRIWRPESGGQALSIGLAWLGMTIAFEFLFGHFVAGHTWGRLLEDYDLLAGRVWVAILVWVAVAPSLFYRLQR